MIAPEIFSILLWLLVILGLELSTYFLLYKSLKEYALPLSFGTGLILFMFLTWYLAIFEIPSWISFLIIIIPGLITAINIYPESFRVLKNGWQYYAVFILIFISLLIVRLYSPDINGAEKFMDHGFIASIMLNPIVPPPDPWFAGGNLDVYYYMGHWLLSMTGLIAGIPSYYVFTLALPTIAAVAGVSIYGVGKVVLKRYALLPVIVLFSINPAFLSEFFSGTAQYTLLWNSTRVIENTINEYPLFSVLFGDVHAHVMGFIPQTSFILITAIVLFKWNEFSRNSKIAIIGVAAVSLAALPLINTWDVLVYAPVVIATGLILCITRKDGLFYLIGVPALSLVIAGPVILKIKAVGVEGLGFVSTPSDIFSFMLVWGFFILFLLLSLRQEIKNCPFILLLLIPGFVLGYLSATCALVLLIYLLMRMRKEISVQDFFAFVGLCLMILVEFVYLKDNMGEVYYRMNTVFKLGLCAWIILGTGVALMAGRELQKNDIQRSGFKHLSDALIIILFLILIIVPPAIAGVHGGVHTPTLNGEAWLSIYHPEDDRAITYLQTMPEKDKILVEAVDGDYAYHSRVSSMTGIQTVLGWPFHESMWRQDNPPGWYEKRRSDIRLIYEDPDMTLSLMNRYKASLLYLGPTERETYNVTLPGSGLTRIYDDNSSEGVIIYSVSPYSPSP